MSDKEFLANLKKIDNEKLIQSLQTCGHDGYYNDLYSIIEEIKRRLSSTSAEQERKIGYWIDTDNYYQRWKCSECGCYTRDAEPNYCSHCGTKMERES